jgi:hypothetical protein
MTTRESRALDRRSILLGGTTLAAVSAMTAAAPVRTAQAQQKPQPQRQGAPASGKPNILVIFGDDIGITNVSTYAQGLMGYETPNTASPTRASSSCTITASSRAPPAARPSSPDNTSSAPG